MILYFIVTIALRSRLRAPSLPHGTLPDFKLSAMNGFGPFVAVLAAYEVYWGLFAVALAILSNLMWVRGTPRQESRARSRTRSPMTGAPRALGVLLSSSRDGPRSSAGHRGAKSVRVTRDVEKEKAGRKDLQIVASVPQRASKKMRSPSTSSEPRPRHLGDVRHRERHVSDIPRIAVTLPQGARAWTLSFGRGETRSIYDERLPVRRLRPPGRFARREDRAHVRPLVRDAGLLRDLATMPSWKRHTRQPDWFRCRIRPYREIVETKRAQSRPSPDWASLRREIRGVDAEYGTAEADWIELDAR